MTLNERSLAMNAIEDNRMERLKELANQDSEFSYTIKEQEKSMGFVVDEDLIEQRAWLNDKAIPDVIHQICCIREWSKGR